MNRLKIVAISDTHGSKIKGLPEADLLIHAGDFSGSGTYQEFRDFVEWIQTIRHRYKEVIVCPGNHDRWVETNLSQAKRECLDSKITLLVDEEFEFQEFILYATPWTPVFGHWAFMADSEKRKLSTEAIPVYTDILISHGPPLGHLDELDENGSEPGLHVGCEQLKKFIDDNRPQLHIFGHIHEGSGVELYRKRTLLVNAAHMDSRYNPVNAFKVIYL